MDKYYVSLRSVGQFSYELWWLTMGNEYAKKSFRIRPNALRNRREQSRSGVTSLRLIADPLNNISMKVLASRAGITNHGIFGSIAPATGVQRKFGADISASYLPLVNAKRSAYADNIFEAIEGQESKVSIAEEMQDSLAVDNFSLVKNGPASKFGCIWVHVNNKAVDPTQRIAAKMSTNSGNIFLAKGQHDLVSPAGPRSPVRSLHPLISVEETEDSQSIVQRKTKDLPEPPEGVLVADELAGLLNTYNRIYKLDDLGLCQLEMQIDILMKIDNYIKKNISNRLFGYIYSMLNSRAAYLRDLEKKADDELNMVRRQYYIKKRYNIDIDQRAGINAIFESRLISIDKICTEKGFCEEMKESLKNDLNRMIKVIEPVDWTINELDDLISVLGMFYPSFKGDASERSVSTPIRTISRLNHNICGADKKFDLWNDEYGETFKKSKVIALFNYCYTSNEPESKPQEFDLDQKRSSSSGRSAFRGTLFHEFSHGLFGVYLEGFKKTMKYWRTLEGIFLIPVGQTTLEECKSNFKKQNIEFPCSEYGTTDADEDLAEATRLYFQDQKRLKDEHKERFAFIKDLIDSLNMQSSQQKVALGSDCFNPLKALRDIEDMSLLQKLGQLMERSVGESGCAISSRDHLLHDESSDQDTDEFSYDDSPVITAKYVLLHGNLGLMQRLYERPALLSVHQKLSIHPPATLSGRAQGPVNQEGDTIPANNDTFFSDLDEGTKKLIGECWEDFSGLVANYLTLCSKSSKNYNNRLSRLALIESMANLKLKDPRSNSDEQKDLAGASLFYKILAKEVNYVRKKEQV